MPEALLPCLARYSGWQEGMQLSDWYLFEASGDSCEVTL